MTLNARFAALSLYSLLAAACSAPAQDAVDFDDAIEVDDNALGVTGTWVRPSEVGPLGSQTNSRSAGGFTLDVCITRMPDGTQHAGKVFGPAQGPLTCRVEWGARVQRSTQYIVLRRNGYRWVDAIGGLPGNAVIGDIGGALPNQPHIHVYVCEAFKYGTWHPGKWWDGGCRFEYSDRYEVVKPYGVPNSVHVLTR